MTAKKFGTWLLIGIVAPMAMVTPVSAADGISLGTTHTGGDQMVLCAPAGTTTAGMKRAKTVVSRRIRHGFKLPLAKVTLTGSDCITVVLPHTIKWLSWLARDVSGFGRFGIGISYPNAKAKLTAGELIRYKNDPLTSANQKLPEVKVVIGRPGFVGWTSTLQHRSGYAYVGVKLTTTGTSTLCTFTKQNIDGLAVVVLDHYVITDEQVTVKICGGSLLTGFPQTSLDKPLGPREVVAVMHSGVLHVALSISSLS